MCDRSGGFGPGRTNRRCRQPRLDAGVRRALISSENGRAVESTTVAGDRNVVVGWRSIPHVDSFSDRAGNRSRDRGTSRSSHRQTRWRAGRVPRISFASRRAPQEVVRAVLPIGRRQTRSSRARRHPCECTQIDSAALSFRPAQSSLPIATPAPHQPERRRCPQHRRSDGPRRRERRWRGRTSHTESSRCGGHADHRSHTAHPTAATRRRADVGGVRGHRNDGDHASPEALCCRVRPIVAHHDRWERAARGDQ